MKGRNQNDPKDFRLNNGRMKLPSANRRKTVDEDFHIEISSRHSSKEER